MRKWTMKPPRMTLDELVNKIVDEKALSRKQVFDLIEKKKGNLNWMISDEGAAEIVAKELGVETYQDSCDDDLALTIADLVTGMSNVMVTGRVTGVRPAREFNDKSGGKSVVANLTISDKSGEMRVVLWGEAAKPVQNNDIDAGNIVRIHNGYVREDLGGRPELHVGRRGYLEVNPADTNEKYLPDSSRKLTEINQLTADMAQVNVAGVVSAVYPTKLIKTKEGKEVKLSSLLISDETGTRVRIVFWNDRTSLMDNIRKGDATEIISGRVHLTRNKEIEIHIDSTSTINVSPTDKRINSIGADTFRKISEARSGLTTFSTKGVITEEPRFREFVRTDGTTGKILSFVLSDDASSIRVVAWGEHAENLRHLQKGYVVTIRNAKLRAGMKGDLEAHVNNVNSVEIMNKDRTNSSTEEPRLGSSMTEISYQTPLRRRISELRDGENAEIRGIITKVNGKTPIYMACPKCFRKVEKKDGSWHCSKDGNIPQPSVRVLYSVTLDDGNDTIVCTLSGRTGEELLEMKHNEELSEADAELLRNESNLANILGLDIVFDGKYYQNQKLNRKDFKVTRVIRPDPRFEAKMLLEQIKNDLSS
jgi:replication factor A1